MENFSIFSLIRSGWSKSKKNRKPFFLFGACTSLLIAGIGILFIYRESWFPFAFFSQWQNHLFSKQILPMLALLLGGAIFISLLIKAFLLAFTRVTLVTFDQGKVDWKSILRSLKALPSYALATWLVRLPLYGSVVLYLGICSLVLGVPTSEKAVHEMREIPLSGIRLALVLIFGFGMYGFILFWQFRYHLLRFVYMDTGASFGILTSIKRSKQLVQGMTKNILSFYGVSYVFWSIVIASPYFLGQTMASWFNRPHWMHEYWFYGIWVLFSWVLALWCWPSRSLSQAGLYRVLGKRPLPKTAS